MMRSVEKRIGAIAGIINAMRLYFMPHVITKFSLTS
jgi:hypothetical protein